MCWQKSLVVCLRRLAIGVAAGCAICIAAGSEAYAQITVKGLLESAVTDISQEVGSEVQKAITLFSNGKFEDARNTLKALRRTHPELPPAGVLMGQMFFAINQRGAGRAEVEQVAIEDPGDPEPYLIFGDLAFQGQRFTESMLCFERANALVQNFSANPKRKQHLRMRTVAGLAAVASARRQYAEEEKYLKEWIQIEPDSTAAYTRLGRAQFNQGSDRHRDAYATFRKLYDDIDKEIDPAKKVPRPEINMALLYTQDDKLPNAKKLMDLAAERAAADDMTTQLAVAQWALQNGYLDRALESALAAEKVDPKSAQALMAVGLSARYSGKYDDAQEAFEKVWAMSPASFAALNNLALTLVEQPGEEIKNKALQFAQMNQRANNETQSAAGREAAATLAWVLHRTGRAADAERVILAALQAGSVTNESAYHAAQILADRERNEQAKQILEPLLAQPGYFPGRKEARDLLDGL